MKKSLLAFLLALAMLLSMTSVYAEELEMSDVPNMTAPGVLPIVLEPVTITFAFAPNSTVTDFKDNKWTNWLEENTGINIEFFALPSENPGQKLELMLSSGETMPDVIDTLQISNASLYNYYLDGSIIALDELIEKYAYYLPLEIETYFSDGSYAAIDQLTRTFDGAQIKWSSTYHDPSNDYNPGHTLWLREDWLEKAGLGVPTTVDELYDVLVAFRDGDMNGNGQADEIPLLGGVNVLINSYVYYFQGWWNGDLAMNVEDGQVYLPQTTDEYRQALTFCNKLVNENLLSQLTFTADDAQMKAMCSPESADQAIVGGFCSHPTSFLDTDALRNSYTPVYPIYGPEGKCYSMYTPSNQQQAMAITGDCEHPEIAVRLLDYFSEEETMIRSRWGARGEDWEYVEDATGMTGQYEELGYGVVYEAWNNPWASSNNMIWKYDCFTHLPAQLMGGRPLTTYDDPDKDGYNAKVRDQRAAMWGNEPDEVVRTILYTEEEELAIAETQSSLKTYMEECTTRFVMGEMSLENDWDTYLATLESIGMSEYLEIVQTAYTRTIGG